MSGGFHRAGCCCGSGGGSSSPCGYCSDRTPVSLEVMFSSIVVCTGCRQEFGGGVIGYMLSVIPPTPAGPYTLTQVAGDNCKYRYTVPVTGEWMMSLWPGCPDEGALFFPFMDLVIEATFNSASIEMEAFWTHAMYGPMTLHGAQSFFFAGSKSQTVCDGPFTITNDRSSCYNTPDNGGHSGLATVVSKWS
ncbi:MAG: hypothetical protein QGH15_21430 [Kiritimatiellia bacterium]|nr:hypothetical protein [Kiritimatiellia bacterium]